MPLTIKRTNTTSIAANSVLFNGSNQYLSIANNAAFNLSTGSFTVECWFYATANVSSTQCLITNYGGPSAGWAIQIFSGVIGANVYGDGFAISGGIPVINTWYHVALSGAQGSIKLFLNGVQIGSTYTGAVSMNTSAAVTIGNIVNTAHMAGYISNARVVKGTALYTASFTAPTTPLTAIANTSLLTCNAATIIDGSTNNFTITNNNSATVSSINPFRASTNNFQFVNRNNNTTVLAGTQKAIFGYGYTTGVVSITNLVGNTGVVATDTTGVGTGRYNLAAAGYGTDKAIFGYGQTPTQVSITNLVSNTGVVTTDTAGVGTSRHGLAAAGYGSDKAIFGYGYSGVGNPTVSKTNKVSNTGVVATDITGVGTARHSLAATGYGNDKAIFGYGCNNDGYGLNMTNLVSNTGVVASDTGGVGTSRAGPAAASYGSDKAIFGYGNTSTGIGLGPRLLAGDGSGHGDLLSITNLVSNTGVVATDTTGIGTTRHYLSATGYGNDKAIFGYGQTTVNISMTNLVSNTGVVATDTTGVGTARSSLAAAGYSTTIIPAPSGFSLKKVYADPATIVTNGLVLNLDASNASSYPGSGTTWTDLSGNGNTGTLTNGPTFNSANGGSIVFDGSDDYISIGSQNVVGTGTSAFTGELWWYINKTLASGEYIMPIRIKQDTEFFVGLYNPSGTYNLYGTFRLSTQYGIPVTNSDYINKWICMQFVYTGGNKNSASSYKFYINGAQIAVGSNSFGPAGGQLSNCNIIGSDGNNGCNVFFTSGLMKGNIASYRLYTGELTAAQLLQNYNATRARFGL